MTLVGGWIDADGARWRPLRAGEARRLGDRWFRLDDAGRCGWCRSMSATVRDAFEALDQGERAARSWPCNAVPMRPETQRGPFPPPVYLHDLRPGTQGLAGLLPRPADLAARGAEARR